MGARCLVRGCVGVRVGEGGCVRVLVWVRVWVRVRVWVWVWVLVFVYCFFFFAFLDFCLLGSFVLVYNFKL